MSNIHDHKILILDFGSQYTQLIARRVREIGVYCELHPFDYAEDAIKAFSPNGIILSGGPNTVTSDVTPRIAPFIFELGVPLLGICYGMQSMAEQLGGKVSHADKREFGYAKVSMSKPNALLEGLTLDASQQMNVWMSHGDHVIDLPNGFDTIASSDNAPIAAIANEEKGFYGVQFHPEVTHTEHGFELLSRFVLNICHCQTNWKAQNIINDAIETIRKDVKDEEVILGLSGGVDSSVVAAILHEAIGQQLTCVFVDNGLLRLNEADLVMQTFKENLGVKVIKVDAKAQFYDALKGEDCPEQKRKIVGKTFIDVFEEQANKLPNAKWLAQGTIYPDVIESAGAKTQTAKVIKSHHNVGGLPETMNLKLLEPLRELFKDEVRKVGLELGLPEQMVYRHPFPGPGLSVRILGEVKESYADILRQADAIFIQTLHEFDWYDKVAQAFVVFLPVKSVGVMGDAREYDYVVSIRAVETSDFMTANWARLPYELLDKASNRIINEVRGISRVVYDISGKPPATIEWE